MYTLWSCTDNNIQEEGVLRHCEEIEYQLILRSMNSGHEYNKTKFAWYKLSGRGGSDINEETAVALLQERVQKDDSEAMWMLGICNEYGLGCDQDIETAEVLYSQSSSAGNKVGDFLCRNVIISRASGVMKHSNGSGLYLS